MFYSWFRDNVWAAAEQIHANTRVLWPSMNRQVRLGEDDHPGQPVRTKFVERGVDYRGTRQLGSMNHDFFEQLA